MTTIAKKTYLLIWGAWLLHISAWFLPVMAGEDAFPRWLPGWEAFRAALWYVWPYEGLHMDVWYHTALATISALTTILFLLASPLVVMKGSRWVLNLSAWIAGAAFVIDAHWYVLYDIRVSLRIGYFLWWLSFLFLAVGLFRLSGQRASEPR